MRPSCKAVFCRQAAAVKASTSSPSVVSLPLFQFFFIVGAGKQELLQEVELAEAAHFEFQPGIEGHKKFVGVLFPSQQSTLEAFALVGDDVALVAVYLFLQGLHHHKAVGEIAPDLVDEVGFLPFVGFMPVFISFDEGFVILVCSGRDLHRDHPHQCKLPGRSAKSEHVVVAQAVFGF